MGRIENLIKDYGNFVSLTWDKNIPPCQKVWLCIYSPEYEQYIRKNIDEFQYYTLKSNHLWKLIDITTWQDKWVANLEYRDEYFSNPEYINDEIDDLRSFLLEEILPILENSDENTLVAIIGLGSLFPMVKISTVIDLIEKNSLPNGRLLLFFPGSREENKLRLFGASDGWNYQATVIEVHE